MGQNWNFSQKERTELEVKGSANLVQKITIESEIGAFVENEQQDCDLQPNDDDVM